MRKNCPPYTGVIESRFQIKSNIAVKKRLNEKKIRREK
jgi:hypothetical protein